MTERPEPVSEADLHAYVDGQLSARRRAEVEAHLADDPRAARRVDAYRAVDRGVRALFDPMLGEPVPARLLHAPSRHGAVRRSLGLAATIALGIAVGWSLRAWEPSDVAPLQADLVAPAAFAHAVFASDAVRPVEIGAAQAAQLEQWLSRRLDTPLRAPDLSAQGYALLGGRLLPSTDRMAAQFMYQDPQGGRVTLYQRRGHWDDGDQVFGYAQRDQVAVLFWTHAQMGYALAGTLDKEHLLALAAALPDAPGHTPTRF